MGAEQSNAHEDSDWKQALCSAAAAALNASAVTFFSRTDAPLAATEFSKGARVVEPAMVQAARRARSSPLRCAVAEAPGGRVLAVSNQADEALAIFRERPAFRREDQDVAEQLLAAWKAGTDQLTSLESALSASRRDFALSAHLAQFGIWSFDMSAQKLTWSDELYEIYEIDPLETIDWERAQRAVNEDRRHEYVDAVAFLAGMGQPFDLELPIRSEGGMEKWVRVFGDAEWRDGAVERIFGFAQDISDQVMLRDDMTLLATRDYLTEVANRASFTNMFAERCFELEESDHEMAFFVIDVDHFKTINDSFGHDVGDQILREVSGVLLTAVRSDDVVGRLGGDEFGVIAITPRGAGGAGVADRILDIARRSDHLRRIGGGVTLSIGYAEICSPNWTFKEALKAADLALYEAKRGGRDQACCYREEFGVAYGAREATLSAVDKALKADQFEPYYQAKVELATGRVGGFEALARWNCPERGVLGPGEFFHAIEDLRLGTRISERIIERSIRDYALLKQKGLDFGPVALNVTEKQLSDPQFAEGFAADVAAAGLRPEDFEIEITEAVLLARNVDLIRANLNRLSELGSSIALDDFGTGFASLTHLLAFPINTIKIDKSFVTDFESNRETQVICGALVNMAHDLKMRVVAEGVETEGGAAQLRALGCDLAQGFYYARPCGFDALFSALQSLPEDGVVEGGAKPLACYA